MGSSENFASIGEVARRAGVPASTIRYYERRGLLTPDARVSGQRRYTSESTRLLVFVGLLKDAGLSLEDVAGIIGAHDRARWKDIAARRLAALDEEIARLERSRSLLAGALLCRYNHPLTECKVMGAEIDRRLAASRAG